MSNRPTGAYSEGTIVVLEPIEVKTDDSEIIRKVDNLMKARSVNAISPEMLLMVTEQNRKLMQDAQYDLRASQRFFSEDEQHIGPADVPGTGGITVGAAADTTKSAIKMIKPIVAEYRPRGRYKNR